MNFNMSSSHGLQFLTNCPGAGPSHRPQSFSPSLLPGSGGHLGGPPAPAPVWAPLSPGFIPDFLCLLSLSGAGGWGMGVTISSSHVVSAAPSSSGGGLLTLPLLQHVVPPMGDSPL